jgi:hypothetical protein
MQLNLQFCRFGRKWPKISSLSSKVESWKKRVGHTLTVKEEKRYSHYLQESP